MQKLRNLQKHKNFNCSIKRLAHSLYRHDHLHIVRHNMYNRYMLPKTIATTTVRSSRSADCSTHKLRVSSSYKVREEMKCLRS